MKRKIILIALLLGLASFAGATPFVFDFGGIGVASGLEPTVDVTVNGQDIIPLTTSVSVTGTGFAYSGSGKWVNPADPNDFVQFSFAGFSDSDPFINWADAVTTGSKGASISFVTTQPTVGTFTTALAGFNGSLGVVKKGQLASTSVQTNNYLDATNVIVLPSPPADCNWGIQSPAVNKPCPVSGGQFGPKVAHGSWTNPLMKVALTYDVTPNTAATFNGQFLISTVPEPASFALIGAGLIALAAFGRKLAK